ncbi:MAG: universal stress protein [Candidatus Dechloromonas phosphoritropha]
MNFKLSKEQDMSYELKSILYASDLSPRSPAVFMHAVGLAQKFGAKLHAMTVSLPATSLPYMSFITEEKFDEIKAAGHNQDEELLRKRINDFAEAHPEMAVHDVLVSVRAVEGDAARRILDMAKHVVADVIVMGSRGHTSIGEFILGSVAHKVTMKTDVPVILVPIDR